MNTFTRIFDIPHYQLEKFPQEAALVTKSHGKWHKTSTESYIDQANQVSKALLNMGIKKGDKIALITSANRTEWNIMDIGILQIGAVTVPIYPTISAEDYQYVLTHSESLYVFVSDEAIFKKLQKVAPSIPKLRGVFSFDDIPNCESWQTVIEAGRNHPDFSEVEKIKASIQPEDLASIIYTSGTTGKPKGVMLSHENIVANVKGSTEKFDLTVGNCTSLSFLPCCHIFERTVLYIYQANGVSIHFAESIDALSQNLQEVKPKVMTVVPRVLEKVFDKIYAKGSELSGIKKALFFWAIKIGEKYGTPEGTGAWYNFQLKWARKLIFSKWSAALGGNLDYMVSGSAALATRLSRIFAAADIPVLEGYGLTETSPVISVNDRRNNGWRIGSIGKILSNVQVKIAEDGEILCKGPSITKGYYKDEEKTHDAFTDGWFHTGDIGKIDEDGFLFITDRKKEMFKTSGGKYVAPQVLENIFKQSRFIEQIMVIGEGEKMPAALIQPNFEYIRGWAKIKGISIGTSAKELVSNEHVIDRIQKELDRINPKFGKWEQVKKFQLTPEEWSIDGGELTPTLKLKRKVIKEKYQELYDKIYRSQEI